MLIVFEGIDGSGKNTQIRKLISFLRQHKVKHRLHKYPTERALEARAHLLGEKDVAPLELARIFATDIASEQEKIAGEIASGLVVVCDRYIHSTLAYQGVAAGYAELRAELARYAIATPDLVVLLDIGAQEAAKRKKEQKEPDRHEKDVAFLAAVRENYLKMEREGFLSYKYAVIDAARPEDEVFTDVITQVEPLIIKKIGK